MVHSGLVGNAKAEYLIVYSNFTQMDENSLYDVCLYRLYFITLYRDPDYTNKQETKQE